MIRAAFFAAALLLPSALSAQANSPPISNAQRAMLADELAALELHASWLPVIISHMDGQFLHLQSAEPVYSRLTDTPRVVLPSGTRVVCRALGKMAARGAFSCRDARLPAGDPIVINGWLTDAQGAAGILYPPRPGSRANVMLMLPAEVDGLIKKTQSQ